MKTARLLRTERSDEGTFGHLICENFHLHTGELPWRGNRRNISCIPADTYLVVWEPEGKYKGYVIKDVPDRGQIEIHIANFFGDVSKGLKADVEGCIGPGLERGRITPEGYSAQEAVISSGKAMKRFHAFFNQATFRLIITDNFNEEDS